MLNDDRAVKIPRLLICRVYENEGRVEAYYSWVDAISAAFGRDHYTVQYKSLGDGRGIPGTKYHYPRGRSSNRGESCTFAVEAYPDIKGEQERRRRDTRRLLTGVTAFVAVGALSICALIVHLSRSGITPEEFEIHLKNKYAIISIEKRAMSAFKQGDVDKARQLYDNVLSLFPEGSYTREKLDARYAGYMASN